MDHKIVTRIRIRSFVYFRVPVPRRSFAVGRRGPVPDRRVAIEHVNYTHVEEPGRRVVSAAERTSSSAADNNF